MPMAISLLRLDGITLGHPAKTREEAIAACGQQLVKLGAVRAEYIESMLTREVKFSTYLGNEVAMPHGDLEARRHIQFDQLVLIRLQNQIDWSDNPVRLVIGLAAKGNIHVELLGSLSEILSNSDLYQVLMTTQDPKEVFDVLLKGMQPSAHK